MRQLGDREGSDTIASSLKIPSDAPGWFLRGVEAIQRGHSGDGEAFESAVDALMHAVFAASRPLYYFELAHAAAHAGRRDVIDLVVRGIETRWPAEPWSWYWIGEALSLHCAPRTCCPSSHSAPSRHDLERARLAFERALALDPGLLMALDRMGAVLLDLQRPREALEAFEKSLVLAPGNPAFHVRRAIALGRLQRFEEAIAAYDTALAIDPKDSTALANLAGILAAMGRRDEALRRFRQAVDADPRHAHAWNGLSHLLFEAGQTAEAESCVRRAIALEPAAPAHRQHLAEILIRSGRPAEAMVELDLALRRAPDDPALSASLGLALRFLGRMDDALATWRQAIKTHPRDTRSRMYLAGTLAGAGATPEAIEHLKEVVRIEPDHAPAWTALGLGLHREGRFLEALEAYRKGRSGPTWTADLELQLLACEEAVTRDEAISLLLAKEELPQAPEELEKLAATCRELNRFEDAARLMAASFARNPSRAGEITCARRVLAAGDAARASVRAGAVPNPRQRAALRAQALGWLREELEAWREACASGGERRRSLARNAVARRGEGRCS